MTAARRTVRVLDCVSDVAAYLVWAAGLAVVVLLAVALGVGGTHLVAVARVAVGPMAGAFAIVGATSVITALAAAALEHDSDQSDPEVSR
jgi:hypothetical protein